MISGSRSVLALLALPGALRAQTPTVVPRAGLVIHRSVRVAPGVYDLPASPSMDSALLVVRGDDVTVDFRGVTLRGIGESVDPDRALGVAVRVDGGRHVTIRGARVRGYKIAILARGTRALRLEENDVSYNWKPRLYSLVEHESLVDWLSFHHNEAGEWLRFGAALYLDGVRGGEIRGNRAEQGMNALLMVRSDSMQVWNNVFSFNSGLGIGLYRSSANVIAHNHVDYDVRGYSHGFYHRGEDSAGILLYEQSSHNVIAYNVVTHGGDGFFLWAGQSTMDTGTGGANDNLVYGNDFSFAPANGIEATFSRNDFVDNRVAGSDYGMWGGYSYDTRVLGNRFVGNRVGVAIEHGQNNTVRDNLFDGDTTAVSLWANPIEPSDWGYPKHRDTRSRDTRVEHNAIVRARVGVRASRTQGLTVRDNRFARVDSTLVLDSTQGVTEPNVIELGGTHPAARYTPPDDIRRRLPIRRRGALAASTALSALDRSAIVVDEWGPYDYRSPKLWPLDTSHASPLRLAVLGAPGTWRVVDSRGLLAVSKRAGRLAALGARDTLVVTPAADSVGDWEVQLEYRGAATMSPRGARGRAGSPYRFSYGRFEPRIDWTVRWFTWADSTDPRGHGLAFLEHGTPLLAQQVPRLDYLWYQPRLALPRERLGFDAVGTVDLPAGQYTIRTISDDGVRVWIDDTLAIDHWAPHESQVDFAPMSGGRHRLRVAYYQVDGWTELRVEILRGLLARSAGSPGPH